MSGTRIFLLIILKGIFWFVSIAQIVTNYSAYMLETLGKNFIVGLSGSTLTSLEKSELARLKPAGIIIFKHNIARSPDWQEQLSALIAEVKEITGRTNLIVSIDHEGGLVHRLPSPITHFASARDYCTDASNVGRKMGCELRTLGINLNFAPVLDIHSEEKNPIIGTRAFGTSANEVISASLAFKNAQEKEGVIACGKHFPGHGATTCDSHLELPVLDISKDLLEKRELAPFRAFIQDGAKLIMSAHILFPALDKKYPATLSKIILTELLRKELGFSGCIVTDDLEMKALSKYSRKEIGTLALNAGADLLLVANAHDKKILSHAIEMAEGVMENVKAGVIGKSVIEESHQRIEKVFNHANTLV